MKQETKIKFRLEYLRGELRKEQISYEELVELQSLAEHIAPDDVELLEAASVPENTEREIYLDFHNPLARNKYGDIETE